MLAIERWIKQKHTRASFGYLLHHHHFKFLPHEHASTQIHYERRKGWFWKRHEREKLKRFVRKKINATITLVQIQTIATLGMRLFSPHRLSMPILWKH